MLHIPIPKERAGMELDEFLCLSYPLLTKGYWRRQVREGKVTIDGTPTVPGHRVREDDVLIVAEDPEEEMPDVPLPHVEIDVLYEDDHVMVVDKPAGLASEPERWARENACLSSALLEMALRRAGIDRSGDERADDERAFDEGSDTQDSGARAVREPAAGLAFRPRLVHRLDKDTTGAVLVAKSIEAERELRAAFDSGQVRKTYLALVEGEHRLPDGEHEIIDLPIGPDERKSGRMRIDRQHGKPSQTRIRVEQRFKGYTLLACEPLTGRTHQIRVHLREVGFPLAVDSFYGRRDSLALSDFKRDYRKKPGHDETPLIGRLTLHAREIEFPRVEGEGRIRVEAPIPKDLARALKQLAKFRAP